MSQWAEWIAARREEIAQRWAARVRQHVSMGGEARMELEDALPHVLNQLEAILRDAPSQGRTSPGRGWTPGKPENSARRFRPGFSLSALVQEYGVLRGLLHDLLDEAGLQPSLDEVWRLNDFVATAIAEAVEEHARQEARLQQQAQRSEAWLSTVLRSIGDAVIVTDVEGRAVFLNPVAETLTGWTGDEARGVSLARIFHIIHESTHAVVDSPVDRALREGWVQGLASHTLLVRRDGTHVPIDDSAAPLRDAVGVVSGVVLVFRDVSDKKRQEVERERLLQETVRLKALAEGERSRLSALIHQASAAIVILRGRELILEMPNAEMCRVWGRTREQLRGKPMLEALPELVQQGFDTLLLGVMDTGKPFVGTELSVPVRRPDGLIDTCYFNVTYAPWSDETGAAAGVIAIAMEVTEGVLSRRALQSERERSERDRAAMLEALATQTLVGLSYRRGPELVFQTANSVYRHIVGRDVVGLGSGAALPELEEQGTLGLLRRTFQTGEPYVAREMPVQVAQGLGGPLREGLFDVTYQPVRAPDDSIDGVLTLVVEVTEQVRLRNEALRLVEEERGRRDFEQHLIGIVSHDLRTPLSAILLGLQVLLRREGLDARTHQSLSRLQSSTERAVRLVRDLLDFTQARLGGGLKMEGSPGDLHTLVRGVVDELQVTHPERELRLVQRGDGRGRWDADRVSQLVGNLVSNALKYSPPHTPVTVLSEGGPGGGWLEIHNEGEPISATFLPRLFQPLQRAVEGIDKSSRSVGLGLYIVDQIVRAHAGSIHVTSTRAGGTTFKVHLPHLP